MDRPIHSSVEGLVMDFIARHRTRIGSFRAASSADHPSADRDAVMRSVDSIEVELAELEQSIRRAIAAGGPSSSQTRWLTFELGRLVSTCIRIYTIMAEYEADDALDSLQAHPSDSPCHLSDASSPGSDSSESNSWLSGPPEY